SKYLTDYQNPTGYSQTLAEASGHGLQTLNNNFYTDESGPIAHSHSPDSPEADTRFLYADHLSTNRLIASASLGDAYSSYTPFGETTGSVLSNYSFTGQYRDPATSLQYHRARWLSTAQGRWQ